MPRAASSAGRGGVRGKGGRRGGERKERGGSFLSGSDCIINKAEGKNEVVRQQKKKEGYGAALVCRRGVSRWRKEEMESAGLPNKIIRQDNTRRNMEN